MARGLVAARLSQLAEAGPSRLDRDDDTARAWAEAQGHTVVATTADVVWDGRTRSSGHSLARGSRSPSWWRSGT